MKINRCILKSYPEGKVSTNNFAFETVADMKPDLKDGQVFVQLKYLSIDPLMRTRINPKGSLIMPAMEVNKPVEGFCVANVLDSKNGDFPVGTLVTGLLPWETAQVVPDPSTLTKLPRLDGVPSTFFLGVLGATGLTAFFAFKKLAKEHLAKRDKPVVFVSGAAGAVGNVFGQLCKTEITNCIVYGSAGSKEKVDHCTGVLGFDDAFNYKDGIATGMDAMLGGKPIDLYFDNVGGAMLDEVLLRMSTGGKILACGVMSDYDKAEEEKYRLNNCQMIVYKCLTIESFQFVQWMDEFAEGSHELGGLLASKKIVPDETVLQGFDKATEALVGLFHGLSVGKTVVSV